MVLRSRLAAAGLALLRQSWLGCGLFKATLPREPLRPTLARVLVGESPRPRPTTHLDLWKGRPNPSWLRVEASSLKE